MDTHVCAQLQAARPPSPAMPLRGHFRQMESQILRNLNIIQEFNLANYTGPISTEHARAQRQRYDIIRENCEVTSNKINHALHISEDPDSVCSRAFHAIFHTLRTMLRNEVTRAEAINLRAVQLLASTHNSGAAPISKIS